MSNAPQRRARMHANMANSVDVRHFRPIPAADPLIAEQFGCRGQRLIATSSTAKVRWLPRQISTCAALKVSKQRLGEAAAERQ